VCAQCNIHAEGRWRGARTVLVSTYIHGGAIATIFMCCVYAYFTDLSKSTAAIPRGTRVVEGGERTEKSKCLSAEYNIYTYTPVMGRGVLAWVCARPRVSTIRRFIYINTCTRCFVYTEKDFYPRQFVSPVSSHNNSVVVCKSALTHSHARSNTHVCVHSRIKCIYSGADIIIIYLPEL